MSKTVKDESKYADEDEILEKKRKNRDLREKRKIRTFHEPEKEEPGVELREIKRISEL